MEIRRCQHIKTNGQQCGSPALRAATVCYFHGSLGHTQHLTINDARYDASPATLTLPVLEDYESEQMAIMQVLQKLTTGHLDRKTAGLLLYGLQIASSNLRYARFDPRPETMVIDPMATHLTPLDGDQWSDEDDEEDDDGEAGDEQALNEDEEDLNEELGDDAELEETEPASVSEHVGADAPVRPRAEREEQPRISDAQFFQALANLCDHRENGTPLKFPVYPAHPPEPRSTDIPGREKRPPATVSSATDGNGEERSGG